MKYLKRFSAIFVAVALLATMLCSCSAKQTPVEAKDFRVTAYVVCSDDNPYTCLDMSNLKQVTDIIVFGLATFDEEGNIAVSHQAGLWISTLKIYSNASTNFYINLLGPASQSDSDDWYEQMDDLAQRHTKAFESGKMEQGIKDVLEKYGLNGVFFDYEFAIKNKYWKPYNKFIVSLDEALGDSYKIGMALASWDLGQNKAAREATDMIELMSYDLWDDSGNHATLDIAKEDIKKVKKAGYDLSKVDLGVPFYARPTDHSAYWYSYNEYADKIDDNGLYEDKGATDLTFSFNTYDVIKQKTQLALEQGLGGVMVWNYNCDLPSDNSKSLFNAINQAKQEAVDAQSK